ALGRRPAKLAAVVADLRDQLQEALVDAAQLCRSKPMAAHVAQRSFIAQPSDRLLLQLRAREVWTEESSRPSIGADAMLVPSRGDDLQGHEAVEQADQLVEVVARAELA